MASPPFVIDETIPAPSDLISQHPANAQTFRDVVESWLNTFSDSTTGKLKSAGFPNPFTITNNQTDFRLESTDPGVGAGPLLRLDRMSASPAANDLLGEVFFRGKDSAGNDTTYADFYVQATNVTNLTEASQWVFRNISAGATVNSLIVSGTAVTVPNSLTVTGSATFSSTATFNGVVNFGGGGQLTGAGSVISGNGIFSIDTPGSLLIRPNGSNSATAQATYTTAGLLTVPSLEVSGVSTLTSNVTISTGWLKLAASAAQAGIQFDDVNAPDGFSFKRITWNDGGANFALRAGNYFATTTKYAATGSGAANIIMNFEGTAGSIIMSAYPTGTAGADVSGGGSVTLSTTAFTATGVVFTGNGSGLTNLAGGNISSGTIDDARLPSTMASKTFTGVTNFPNGGQITANGGIVSGNTIFSNAATGTMTFRPNGPADSTAQMTYTSAGVLTTNSTIVSGGSVGASQTFYSTTAVNVILANGQSTTGTGSIFFRPQGSATAAGQTFISNAGDMSVSGSVTATSFSGSGSGLTSLNGSNISSGTVADARLPATMAGKTFSSATEVNGDLTAQVFLGDSGGANVIIASSTGAGTINLRPKGSGSATDQVVIANNGDVTINGTLTVTG